MSDQIIAPAPHKVQIVESAGHEDQQQPVLVPNILAIDGHQVQNLVHVGGWSITAGPAGETVLGLRVDADTVTVDERGIPHLDGHPLCWPAGRELVQETAAGEDGEPETVSCLVFCYVAEAVIGREPEGETQAAAA